MTQTVPERIPEFDLYAELEVAPNATAETIEAAYRSLVKRHHPDVANGSSGANGGDDRIKRILLARRWLADPERRHRYDEAMLPASRRAGVRVGGSASRASSQPTPPDRVVPTEPRWDAPDRTHFGVNHAAVQAYLAELRTLDVARATEVQLGKAVADGAGYGAARRTAFAISRKQRLSEWLFAREAASIVVRTRLGETALAGQVLEPLADVAGAIAIRDLLTEAQVKLLLTPWTWRGRHVIGREAPAPGLARVVRAGRAPARAGIAARPAPAARAGSPHATGAATPGPIPMPAPKWRVQRTTPLAWRGATAVAGSPTATQAGAGGVSSTAAPRRSVAAASGAGSAPTAPSPPIPLPVLDRRTRTAALAIGSTVLVAIVAVSALGAVLSPGKPTADLGRAGQPSGNPAIGFVPGASSGPATSSAPVTSVPPTLPFTGGIDPARLAELQAAAADTIERLATAARAGKVRAAQALLGDSAPNLDASGLTRANFADVAPTDIDISGSEGQWVARAGSDTLTSTDGVHWTFDYGERPIAVYGRTSEYTLYFLSGSTRREIRVRVNSVTLTRSTVRVALAWRFDSDTAALAYSGFRLTMASLALGGRSWTIGDGPAARLDGGSGSATLEFPLRAIPSARGTIGVAVVVGPGAGSTTIVSAAMKLAIL